VHHLSLDRPQGHGKPERDGRQRSDRLDTAWELTTTSRLGCQAVIKGDVVVEFPLYTRNYVQEGGGIQLGQPEPPDERKDKAEAQP
jgi:hypothetical protein